MIYWLLPSTYKTVEYVPDVGVFDIHVFCARVMSEIFSSMNEAVIVFARVFPSSINDFSKYSQQV